MRLFFFLGCGYVPFTFDVFLTFTVRYVIVSFVTYIRTAKPFEATSIRLLT